MLELGEVRATNNEWKFCSKCRRNKKIGLIHISASAFDAGLARWWSKYSIVSWLPKRSASILLLPKEEKEKKGRTSDLGRGVCSLPSPR
jgi:hypothetical protein